MAPEDIICKICNIQIETEEHFMLFCPKFRKLRLNLIRHISEIDASMLVFIIFHIVVDSS